MLNTHAHTCMYKLTPAIFFSFFSYYCKYIFSINHHLSIGMIFSLLWLRVLFLLGCVNGWCVLRQFIMNKCFLLFHIKIHINKFYSDSRFRSFIYSCIFCFLPSNFVFAFFLFKKNLDIMNFHFISRKISYVLWCGFV